jgi:hypothetical protein
MITIFQYSGGSGSGGGGDIKSDGTVDFIAPEQWTGAGADNAIVSDTGLTVSDGIGTTAAYGAGVMLMSDGINDVLITPFFVSVTSGGQTSFFQGDNLSVPMITDIGTGITITDTSSGISISSGGGIAIQDLTTGIQIRSGNGAGVRIGDNSEGGGIDMSSCTGDILFPNGTTITAAGAVKAATTITTADPGGGTGNWKLGSFRASAVTVNLTKYIEIDIDGTAYKLAVCN